jgi:hypothetical protein
MIAAGRVIQRLAPEAEPVEAFTIPGATMHHAVHWTVRETLAPIIVIS